jgi:hypothetical protein
MEISRKSLYSRGMLEILLCETSRSTWLKLTETLGASTGSHIKSPCDRGPLVCRNAATQRYWMCSRSSPQRDGIRSATASPEGTPLCTWPNGNRFDRETHRDRAEETRTSRTDGVRRNYTGQSSKDFLCVIKSNVPLLATSNYFDEWEN